VIARLGLRDFIDTTHISEREGVRKPDAEIFNRALRALGLSEEEAWYVGDHPDVDVRGAVEAGVTGVWRRTSYWAEPSVPHHAIDDLDELVRLIRSDSGLDEPTAPPG
jgi:putative hydrolase of the HAD superfamily